MNNISNVVSNTIINNRSNFATYSFPVVKDYVDSKSSENSYNELTHSNVIEFKNEVVKNKKLKLDGTEKNTKCNKKSGEKSEVYAFRTKEEIEAIIQVLDKHIDEATNDTQKQIAFRNKLLFIIGINIGIRASDLRTLKWSFFFNKNDDGTLSFKNFYTLQPKKTMKQKKFVKLFFNQSVKTIISNYVEEYPINDLDNYLFLSRQGNNPISVEQLWGVIKNTAKEANIEQNVGSHSLRKTFGFWCWHKADDKNKALVILQQIFSHSSTQMTAKYIGILDDEIEDMFNSIELGLDMI